MPNRLAVLAAAALILGTLAALISRRADRLEWVWPLKRFSQESLFRLEIARQGETDIVLEKKAGLWRLTSPVEDAADDNACAELVAVLSNLQIGAELSSDSAEYGAYGLSESSATHVKIYSRDRAVAALDGYFGGRALGGQALYFRRAREKPVFLAEGARFSVLSRAADDYRERAFFPEKLGTIKTVKLSSGSKVLEPKNRSPEWATSVQLQVADFVAVRKGTSETGLDHPALTIEAAGSARSARWLIGGVVTERGKKTAFRYAACEGRPGVLATVAVRDADALLKSLKP